MPVGVVRLLLLRDAADQFDIAIRMAEGSWKHQLHPEERRTSYWESRAVECRQQFHAEFQEIARLATPWVTLPLIVLAGLR